MLKAGISLGSLGKVATPSDTSVNGSMVPAGYAAAEVPANLAYNFDASVDYHIIQIGANILSAVNPTSYPIRIAFDDGSARGLWEFQGVTDLPYLSYVFNGVLRTRMSSPAVVGGAAGTTQPAEYPLAKPESLQIKATRTPFRYPQYGILMIQTELRAYFAQRISESWWTAMTRSLSQKDSQIIPSGAQRKRAQGARRSVVRIMAWALRRDRAGFFRLMRRRLRPQKPERRSVMR